MEEQPPAQIAVMRDELVGTAVGERRLGGLQRVSETGRKRADAPLEREVTRDQPEGGPALVEHVRERATPPGARHLRAERVGQRLADAHHLLHEAPVRAVAGEQRQHAVPVQQVVVHPAPHESEHVAKGVVLLGNHPLGHAHQPAELAIDVLVDLGGK